MINVWHIRYRTKTNPLFMLTHPTKEINTIQKCFTVARKYGHVSVCCMKYARHFVRTSSADMITSFLINSVDNI